MWFVAVAIAACSSSTTDSVSDGDVASVSVDPPTSTVSVGAQVPLRAIVADAAGKTISGAEVHWSTLDPSIATVSDNGVVTGVKLGTTQIAASSNGKSGIATITVEKTPVASVAVSPPHVDAAPGDHPQFTAIAYDAAQNPLGGRTITWSSSNSNVATIDADGVATAVGSGTATITGTSEGKNGAATITVSQAAVASVTVTPGPLSMTVGQTTQLVATLKDAGGAVLNGRAVTWSSSNTNVASVSSQGVLTAAAPGNATITATSEGKSGTDAITVTNIAVGSVTVQPQGQSIVIGTNIQMSATVRDVNGNVTTDRVVTWSSSNSAIATVSVTGVVTGVAAGSVTITATSEGKSGTAPLTVTLVPVGTVTVAPPSASFRVGATATFGATVKDANGTVVTNRVVTWTSSNTAIATVSAAGVVTGVTPGTATITATSEGKSGTASATVSAIPVGSVTVSPATKALLVLQTFQLTATVKDSTGAVVTDRTVTWTSSAPLVASVSSTGLVTAGAVPGTATITATSETKSGTSTITVALVPVSSVIVQPGHDSIPTNSSAQLTAVTEDSIGGILTGRTVTWSSSAPGTAAVSNTGLVTTNTVLGLATITATSEGKSGTSAITVYVPVATVVVAPASATILVTQTKAFTGTPKDAGGNNLSGRVVTWASSNTAVATINASGVATGVSPGTVTITGTSEGKSGTATLIVNPVPVATVTISPPSPDTVFIGYTTQLSAVTKDSVGGVLTGRTVTWQSGTPGVATVGTTGLVTGVAVGSSTITATSEGKSGSVTMVSIKAPVASVVVSPASDSIATGGSAGTATLAATVTDVKGNVVTDRTIAWTSTATAIATVAPATGASTTVTGKAKGLTNVIATSETKTDTVPVSVVAAVTTVTVNPPSATLSVLLNPTVTLTATCRDATNATVTGRTLVWTSSDPTVASVASTGATTALVTAKKTGSVTITARDIFDNVVSANVNVGVTP